MSVYSIYNNYPYVFETQKDPSGDNSEIIKDILKNIGIDHTQVIVTFLSSNYDFDVYKAQTPNGSYCVKYSLDPDNESLKREFDVIKKLTEQISSIAIYYGCELMSEKIHYSIFSFEGEETVKKSGIALLMKDYESFINNFASFSETSIKIRNLKSYLKDFFKSIDIDTFPEDSISAIKDYTDIEIIKESIESIKAEILSLCSKDITNEKNLCHGNLKPSNILKTKQTFKFIDLTESYLGHPYLDLCSFCIHCGLEQDQELKLLDKFINLKGLDNREEELGKYQKCRDIMSRIIFLNILVEYLKEVYVFSSSRPMKILDIINLFAINSKRFFQIPAINKHYEFIYKSILEPVINKD